MWKEYRIGDILERVKNPVDIEADKEYQLVTIKLYHKGVLPRKKKSGRDIKAKKMDQVYAGQFILSGIDARHGAFGILPTELDGAVISNDFWCLKLNENIIDKHFFFELTTTNWFDELCKRGSDGTTNRIRLQKKRFFNQSIHLPSVEVQKQLTTVIKKRKQQFNELEALISSQQTLLTQLRQAILQEAVSGQLTAKWRAQQTEPLEPASELLARIKAEKEQLVKEKKIKKEKPLPPITQEEIPYELPEGWVWCRLNGVFKFIDYRGKTPKKIESGIRLLTAKNVRPGHLNLQPEEFMAASEYDSWMKRGLPEYGDLLFTTEAPLGNVCQLNLEGKVGLAQRIITFQPYLRKIDKRYFMYSLMSLPIQKLIKEKATGMTAKGIKASKLKLITVPLPPLAEQEAIVVQVNRLMELCDQLEEQLQQSQQAAEQLMQAVLQEAFNPQKEQEQVSMAAEDEVGYGRGANP